LRRLSFLGEGKGKKEEGREKSLAIIFAIPSEGEEKEHLYNPSALWGVRIDREERKGREKTHRLVVNRTSARIEKEGEKGGEKNTNRKNAGRPSCISNLLEGSLTAPPNLLLREGRRRRGSFPLHSFHLYRKGKGKTDMKP